MTTRVDECLAHMHSIKTSTLRAVWLGCNALFMRSSVFDFCERCLEEDDFLEKVAVWRAGDRSSRRQEPTCLEAKKRKIMLLKVWHESLKDGAL